MLEFAIIEIKAKKFQAICSFIISLTIKIVPLTIFISILVIYFSEEFTWLNNYIIVYIIGILWLFSSLLSIASIMIPIIINDNYKKTGICTLNTEIFIIQLDNKQLFNLLATDITKIEIKYYGYSYSNATEFPTLKRLTVQSGSSNTISFLYNNIPHSFFFLSIYREDGEKIKKMIEKSPLFKNKITITNFH